MECLWDIFCCINGIRIASFWVSREVRSGKRVMPFVFIYYCYYFIFGLKKIKKTHGKGLGDVGWHGAGYRVWMVDRWKG